MIVFISTFCCLKSIYSFIPCGVFLWFSLFTLFFFLIYVFIRVLKQYFCCSGYCFIILCFIYCVVFIDLWAVGGLRGSGSSSQLKSWTLSSCLEIKAGQFISNVSFILKKHTFNTSFLFNSNLLILSFYLLTVEVFKPVISLFIRISWRNKFSFLFVLFIYLFYWFLWIKAFWQLAEHPLRGRWSSFTWIC